MDITTDRLNDEMTDVHNSPFIIITDDVYKRMMIMLKNGDRCVKTCNEGNNIGCERKYNLHFLDDEIIVRYVLGIKQEVVPCSLALDTLNYRRSGLSDVGAIIQE